MESRRTIRKMIREMNDYAAAAYPMEVASEEMSALREDKMRLQNIIMNTDAAAGSQYLPEEMNTAAAAASPYLPEDLVIGNILTRLPLRTLAKYSCVSKLWCNSISNNARFAKAHSAHIKNHGKLNLALCLLNIWMLEGGAVFFSLDNDHKFRLLMNLRHQSRTELVGYCNGFPCVTLVRKEAYARNLMSVINPIRKELLNLPYNYPNHEGECEYLCHGFGFDSLTNEYKVVIIFTSKDNEKYFISMVFTLGTNSWRKSITSVAEISPPLGLSPFPSRLVTRRAATLCGGDLFWKISANSAVEEEVTVISKYLTEEVCDNNNRIGMLLSFDIHKEKIQFIRLPTECNLTAPTPTTVVEHHLLERKGYPCVAQSEKEVTCSCRNGQSSFCSGCCCFTVQLYLLKDKEKQVWIKGETYSVQVKDLGPLPAPFCCYFGSSTSTTACFPTRILSVSDQVLLHWFGGRCLKLYNLQTKHLEVVGSSSSCDEDGSLLFDEKMGRFPPFNGIDYDVNDYRLYADCQLHDQAESILSLKSFIPAGDTSRYYDTEEFLKSQKNNPSAGWVSTVKEKIKYRVFF